MKMKMKMKKKKKKRDEACDGMQCNGPSSLYQQVKLEKKKGKRIKQVPFQAHPAHLILSLSSHLAQTPFIAALIHNPPCEALLHNHSRAAASTSHVLSSSPTCKSTH
jgi:hypothetical protein